MPIRNLAEITIWVGLVAAIPAWGQVSTFLVTVPFPFSVGCQMLPAGTYVVERYSLRKPQSPDDTGVIVMKASSHHVYRVVVTDGGEHRGSRSEESELIFTNFKGRQYLNRVLVAGDAVAHQLANLPAEIAAQGSDGEVIVTGTKQSTKNPN